jgi:hypothetical protein
LVIISVIATILFMIIEAVEKLVIPWHSSMRSRKVGTNLRFVGWALV